MRKVQAFFLKNSREIGGKGSIPSRRHPMGVGGLYNPRTCRAGPACPAARSELLPAGHMGPALQSTAAAQGGQSRPPLQNSREIGAKRDINGARERLTPLSDCQKTCPVTSIGGKDTIDWQGQTRLTACLSGAFCSFRLGLRQQACGSKTKNHSKIHRWQVRSSFAGAEMCPDKKRPAENTCRIVKGLDAVWAHFCPSKPCLPLSIDGSVKGNRQGSLSRSITRRSDQNRKIKYCFLFCDFAGSLSKKSGWTFSTS